MRSSKNPVTFTSRCTKETGENYAKSYVGFIAIDFILRRFGFYLPIALNHIFIGTDHQPFAGRFKGKKVLLGLSIYNSESKT